MSTATSTKFRPGVLHGEEVSELLNYANEHDFAIPAVNVIGTDSVNAVLETAREVNSPVIVQFSNGGSAFFAGKGLSNTDQQAAILGGIAGGQSLNLCFASRIQNKWQACIKHGI